MINLTLKVPEEPSILDFQLALKKQLEDHLVNAKEAAFTAELDVANAQRIAIHKRGVANRFQEQLDHVENELSLLTELVAAGKIRPIPSFPQSYPE